MSNGDEFDDNEPNDDPGRAKTWCGCLMVALLLAALMAALVVGSGAIQG